MGAEHLQNLKSKFHSRISRLLSSGWQEYLLLLRQFWTFFDSETTLAAIAEELLTSFPDAQKLTDEIIQGIACGSIPAVESGPEWVAVSYCMMRRFAEQNDSRVVRRYLPHQTASEYNAHLTAFGQLYIHPFYEYFTEHIDDHQLILGQLIRFKHMCEWFWRLEMFSKWESDTSRGEKILARRLYEFLYSEGIDFHIEPWSISGEADLVSSQEGPDRLIADAKIFDPERQHRVGYIVKGFRQIYQYTNDYNEPFGYLIIFNTSENQLRFTVKSNRKLVPFVTVNQRTIFFLVIDLFPHDKPASQRSRPDVVEITENEIIASATADS